MPISFENKPKMPLNMQTLPFLFTIFASVPGRTSNLLRYVCVQECVCGPPL
jgi:hypothetical protein